MWWSEEFSFNFDVSTSIYLAEEGEKKHNTRKNIYCLSPVVGPQNKNKNAFESKSQLKAYLMIYYGKIITVIWATSSKESATQTQNNRNYV